MDQAEWQKAYSEAMMRGQVSPLEEAEIKALHALVMSPGWQVVKRLALGFRAADQNVVMRQGCPERQADFHRGAAERCLQLVGHVESVVESARKAANQEGISRG